MQRLRWPTWHEWIAIAKFAKETIFGKPLYRLSMTIITLGAALAGGASIGQVVIALMLAWTNEKLGNPISKKSIEDALGGAVPLGIGLILLGILIFIGAYLLEERRKRDSEPKFQLAIQPTGNDNWMRAGQDKYVANSKFNVTPSFILVTGLSEVHLTDVSAYYYADGCVCLNVQLNYSIDGKKVEGEYGSSLSTPLSFAAGSAHRLDINLALRPYWMIRAPIDCDYGEFELLLVFLDARSTDQRKLRKFFRLEKGGFLNEIACVSPPPFFSDEMVQQAREKNAISELEHDYLMEIEQTVRFRAWQAQKSSDSALISDINVDEVKAIGQKIRKSLDDQSTEA